MHHFLLVCIQVKLVGENFRALNESVCHYWVRAYMGKLHAADLAFQDGQRRDILSMNPATTLYLLGSKVNAW